MLNSPSHDPQTLGIREHEPLARYTSWRIGGAARFFAEATSPEQLRAAFDWARGLDLPVLILGGGTNMLIRDAGFGGLVLRYRAQDVQLEQRGDAVLALIGAGAPMAGTVRRLARQGYAGLEWAEGLPGTIGGAVYGNAGCYGGDIAGRLIRASLLVGDTVEEWPVERLGYGYRTSALKRLPPDAARPVVLAAEFRLAAADPAALAARMEQTAQARRSKTPSGQSCGSVFKNPPGDSAGRLIEAAGLKGTRIGGAEIAGKHANYIVNLGGAGSNDVLRLIDLARERVASEFGVTLELEVQIV
ncbi:MAG TPA: UDP-N-acetylmuramate dehydrogenase [Roseiflexaceae bacterium]|nr:UDP-N-acetylmuramate dehydrogenase [Roseiflexaceae bacterium]